MLEITSRQVLELELPDKPHGCATVREYLIRLLAEFWRGEASFKYGATGDSDWQYELYAPMIDAGMLPGRASYVNDGYGLDTDEELVLDTLIIEAIRSL